MPDGLDGEQLERFCSGRSNRIRVTLPAIRGRRLSLDPADRPRSQRGGRRAGRGVLEGVSRPGPVSTRRRSFGAWMRRIATNAALDHLRAAQRHTPWRRVADDYDAGRAAAGSGHQGVDRARVQEPRRLKLQDRGDAGARRRAAVFRNRRRRSICRWARSNHACSARRVC